MPANALAAPHTNFAAALPQGISGFSLTFGNYAEQSMVGLTVNVRLSQPMVNLSTGDMLQVTWSATVGPDGTATLGPLPYNDDPALYPTPTGYIAEWQAGRFDLTPGNKNFVVLRSAGPVIDYDLIGTPGYGTPAVSTIALVGSALVGTSIIG